MALLEIQDLQIDFGRGARAVRAVDRVSISLEPGETLGLVGESGAGKSVTALSIARLLPSPPAHFAGGRIFLEGRGVLAMSDRELRRIRGGVVSYVFQEPGASLNPVFRVGSLIREALELHRPEAATTGEVIRLLELVGIPAPEARIRSYPHELSGGMQQRVAIAIAIAARPKILIADEPTTALDVTIQAQIIELLRRLKDELNMAMLLISHNLGLVAELADRVAVLYAGQIVESGRTREVLTEPLHPYTRALLDSVPVPGAQANRLRGILGSAPQMQELTAGCRFHPRCELVQPSCVGAEMKLEMPVRDREVRCLAGIAATAV